MFQFVHSAFNSDVMIMLMKSTVISSRTKVFDL